MTISAIDKSNRLLSSLELYQPAPGQQAKALEVLGQQLSLTHFSGCVAAVLHGSLDRERMLLYRQWRQPEDYYQAKNSTLLGSLLGTLMDSNLYQVAVLEPAEADLSLTEGRLLHLGEFPVKPSLQEQLVAEERRIAPLALQHPDLLAVNFYRSLDGSRTMNYGFWQKLDYFDLLLKEPLFEPVRTYWRPFVDLSPGKEYNEFHFYHISRVLIF
jgi:hypothetical protein